MEFLADYHPITIHFPSALISLYILLELIDIFIKNSQLKYFSTFILLFGVLGGIASVLTGNQEYQLLKSNPLITEFHISMIEKHSEFASLFLWYFIIILILKSYLLIKKKFESRIRYIFIIFTITGFYLLYETAKLGGVLVYKYGIGTDFLD